MLFLALALGTETKSSPFNQPQAYSLRSSHVDYRMGGWISPSRRLPRFFINHSLGEVFRAKRILIGRGPLTWLDLALSPLCLPVADNHSNLSQMSIPTTSLSSTDKRPQPAQHLLPHPSSLHTHLHHPPQNPPLHAPLLRFPHPLFLALHIDPRPRLAWHLRRRSRKP